MGGIEAESAFEIFDCKGAFNVILGKLWLKKVCAIHDYFTDMITIGTDTQREALINSTPPQPPSSLMPIDVTATTNEQDPGQFDEQEQESKEVEQ